MVVKKTSNKAHKAEKVDNKRPVAKKAVCSIYKVEITDSKRPITKKAKSKAHKVEKADYKMLVTEIANNKYFYYLNRRFYKYDYEYVLLAPINLRENFYKW